MKRVCCDIRAIFDMNSLYGLHDLGVFFARARVPSKIWIFLCRLSSRWTHSPKYKNKKFGNAQFERIYLGGCVNESVASGSISGKQWTPLSHCPLRRVLCARRVLRAILIINISHLSVFAFYQILQRTNHRTCENETKLMQKRFSKKSRIEQSVD